MLVRCRRLWQAERFVGNTGGALINPATDPFALTVGAIDVNQPAVPLDDKLATYSATASAARGVDVLAPGTSILSSRVPGSTVDTQYPKSRSADGKFTKGSGTSQAAAVVAGASALLLQQHPTWTPDQVKAALRMTAQGELFITAYGQPEIKHNYEIPSQGYKGDSVFAAQQHYAACLRDGTPCETEGENYLQTVRAMFACYESAETGKLITLK